MTDQPTVLFVCTGNAARSVMGAAMLRSIDDSVRVTSGGTHSIAGLPMSTRTRTALSDFDVSDRSHLSAQVDQSMIDEADLVVIFEPMHLRYLRKEHPEAAGRTASLPRLARDLAAGPEPLPNRVAALNLENHDFEPWEEVVDPAGGDLPVFQDSAAEIMELVRSLSARLGDHACA
jgi:protein-tyrosine phosphatase